MKKLLAGILATAMVSTMVISASAVDYTVGYDKGVTGGAGNPMVEAPTENGVPYGIFNIESEDTVTIPVKGSIGAYAGGDDTGTNPVLPSPYPVSEISVSMPIKLTFGNYSDAKPGTDFTLSQDANQFYSAEYNITNNTVAKPASAKTGKIKVEIVGATQTGNNIRLVDETSIPATYASNQMRVGFSVGTGFTGTTIPNDLALSTGTYKNGATPANTANFQNLIANSTVANSFVLGNLEAADNTTGNTTGNVVGKIGKFKILADASKSFPQNPIQNDFTVTFKFSNVTP